MWSPCTKHAWEKTDRYGIFRCRTCLAAGFMGGRSSPWSYPSSEYAIKPYHCRNCHGDTPAQREICPRCLPGHPLNERIQEYDAGLVEFLSLDGNTRAMLRQIHALGNGPHRIGKPTGFTNAAPRMKNLNNKGYVTKVTGERHNYWSLTDKALKYLEGETDVD